MVNYIIQDASGRNIRLQLLLLAGDVETNPGPGKILMITRFSVVSYVILLYASKLVLTPHQALLPSQKTCHAEL